MSQPRRNWLAKLSVRFAALLALALMPIGVLTYLQFMSLQDEVQHRTESGLLGTTLRVAAIQTNTIREAQGAIAVLAQSLPDVLDDPERCIALMRRVATLHPSATLIAFVPVDGMMRCSNLGKTHDFSGNANFETLRDAKAPTFLVSTKGTLSQTSVLAVSNPVFDDAGTYLGYAVASLAHKALEMPGQHNETVEENGKQLLYFWTFDRGGHLATANIDLKDVDIRLPANRPLAAMVGQPAEVFDDMSRAGNARTYAVVPVIENELYLMSSWSNAENSLAEQFRLTSFLSPLLMWLAGLLLAAIGAERLVTRHVRILNQSITSFAKGDRRLESIELRGAPAELRELGDAYLSMTETITRGEAEIEDTVHQKEVLLREVHHRVKNNLQLIASIMNLQMRKTTSPEAKSLLKVLHDRVMSLATIHRSLYQTTGVADIQAAELLPEIIRQVIGVTAGHDRKVDVKLDVKNALLVPDQAVPLSLLLTEALSNALKHSGQAAAVEIRFDHDAEGEAILSVSAAAPPGGAANSGEPPLPDDGLGAQLITAFCHQLNGDLETDAPEGHYFVSVTFRLSALATGEHRSNADAGE